jgi:hypothetical protein
MPVVDPYDDSIDRHVAVSYRYDPERHERRNVIEIAFDNHAELVDFLRCHPKVTGPGEFGPSEGYRAAGDGARRRVERIAGKVGGAHWRINVGRPPARLSPTRLRVRVTTPELTGRLDVRYASRPDVFDDEPFSIAFPVLEAAVQLDGDDAQATYGWVQMISRTGTGDGPVTTCVARGSRAPAPLFSAGHRPTLSVAPMEGGPDGLWLAESFLVSVRGRRLAGLAALSWGYYLHEGEPHMLQVQELPMHVWGTRRVQLAEHYPAWSYA